LIIVGVLQVSAQAQFFRQARLHTNFANENRVTPVVHLRQDFERLPDARPIVQLVFEPFRQTQRQIPLGCVALLLINKTWASFTAQARAIIFDEVITDTGAERETLLHIRDRIVQRIEAQIPISTFGKQTVVLRETVQRFVVLHAVVLSIGCVGAEAEFIFHPLLGGENVAREEHGVAIAASQVLRTFLSS